jgi:hypothetical protein
MATSTQIPRSVDGSVAPPIPLLRGSVNLAAEVAAIVAVGNYAYVTSYNTQTLSIVDLTNPDAPAVLGTYVNASIAHANGLAVVGNYAYVGRLGGLTVIDVSNPNAPALASQLTLTAAQDHYSCFFDGCFLYVTGGTGAGSGWIYVVDVTEPTNPQIVGSLTNANLDSGSFVLARGRYAYVAGNSGQRINVVDLVDPRAPALVGGLALSGGAIGLALDGRILYATAYSSGGLGRLYCIDIGNDPTTPTSLGVVASATINGALGVQIMGNLAIVSVQGAGPAIVDVRDPTAPTVAFRVSVADNPQTGILHGRYFLQGTYTTGTLKVLDLRAAQVPSMHVGSLAANDIQVMGDLTVGRCGKFDGVAVGPQGLLVQGPLACSGRQLGAQGSDVASANDTTLGLNGNYFDVTGATQMNGIATAGWTRGSMVTLQFDGAPTVKHNTAASAGFASFQLAGAADFAASAGDTLTLRYDGTYWREMCRAVI